MATDRKRAPVFNAPLPVTAVALTLCLLHFARILAPETWQAIAFHFSALDAQRFWAWMGAPGAEAVRQGYRSGWEAFLPLAASGLLHGDIMHVVLNALFLLALGKPLHEIFLASSEGRRGSAAALFAGLALFSQIAGGLAFLAVQGPSGGVGIGSSGAVSGLLGAVLLTHSREGGRLLGRGFLTASAIFVVANAILAIVGPSLLGASIAWETHLGGYIAGALAMRIWLQTAAMRRLT